MESPDNTDLQVAAEQGRLLRRGLLASLVNQLVGLGLLLWFCASAVPPGMLLAVGVMQTALLLLRLPPLIRAQRDRMAGWRLRRFFARCKAIALLDGLGWLALMAIVAPYLRAQERDVFFCISLASGTLTMFSIGVYLPAYFLRLLPLLAGVAYLELTREPTSILLLTAAAAISTLIMYFATRFNRLLLQTIRRGYENDQLIVHLSEQTRLAAALAQSRTRFLAAASHDLRQPMHALALYLAAMEQSVSADLWESQLAKAAHCAQSMEKMFGDLLDVSQLDACTGPETRCSFPVQALLDRIHTEFLPQALERGLALRVIPCRAWVMTDTSLAERMLRNLVSNAIRYTEHGTVLVGCRWRGKRLELQVCDTGVGIAPDQQKLVFDEFYQAGTVASERGKGLGLGLSLVKRMAAIMESEVKLRSQPGRGTRISFTLTRLAVPAGARRAAAAPARQDSALARRLILVIDDDSTILNASRALLESWGCQVLTAYSAAHAVTQVRAIQRAPDIIVSDYRLKDENGIDAILAVGRECERCVPAVLVTGDTASKQNLAANARAIPVLHKPVHEGRLKEVLLQLAAAPAQRYEGAYGIR